MRVVVTGATGNVGTSVVRALRDDASVSHVIGLARRPPDDPAFLDIEWRQVDVAADDLGPHFRHADAVIHLAWLVQPERRPRRLHDVNVIGSSRVFEAVAAEEVKALIHASSFAAYSPGPVGELVDESWPTNGVVTSSYSRQKAYVERLLDRFELMHPLVRVVRLRPGLTFKPAAASEVQRLFLGRLLPTVAAPLVRCSVLPDVLGLTMQAVHTDDVAEAYRLALLGSVTGPYNIVDEHVLDATAIGREFDLHVLPVGPALARSVAAAGWHLRLQPANPGWFDLAFRSPSLGTARAQKELGWKPSRPSFARPARAGRGAQDGGWTPHPTPAPRSWATP